MLSLTEMRAIRARLAHLPKLDQVAEMLADGHPSGIIARTLGYRDAAGVNAQLQRIRKQLGAQAV